MDLNGVKRDLSQALRLVEGWMSGGEVPAIERDMVLRKIRDAYDAVMFAEADGDRSRSAEHVSPKPGREPECIHAAAETPEQVPEKLHDAEPTAVPGTAPATVGERPECEAEESMPEKRTAREDAPANPNCNSETEAEKSVSESEPASAPEAKHEADVAAEPVSAAMPSEHETPQKPQPDGESGSLFGDEEILLRRPVRKSIIMSLYDDAPAEERRHEQTPAPEERVPDMPAENNAVLGEVLRSDVQTIGDAIVHPKDIAASAPVESLRSALSVADRFMLIRDLFGGDEKACEDAIARLDAFDNLDDCMVYIVENYSWRPSSDGAKLIMALLQRKFQ